MDSADVTLRDIGKRYGEHWAVRHADIHIERGAFFTFLGPSGCGKTTLLRIIAGFVLPDEGTVALNGRPVNHVSPWQREIGMVFQNYALWPHLSAFENVAFGLRERKVPRNEIHHRVSEALRQVDLNGVENRRPSELSGGQQQRVALARTLVIRPRVLLLDEPLSNLDAKLRVEMRLELLKLQRDSGITTIYVTHDQEEALAMSTRIAVMSKGHIVQVGTPQEIYEQPASGFVAAFVGGSNLFSGRITKATDDAIDVETTEGMRIRVRLPVGNVSAKGEPVLLSVRPESIELSFSEQPQATNAFRGRIMAAAYRGSVIEYEIETRGKAIKVHAVKPKGAPFTAGQEITIRFSPEDVAIVQRGEIEAFSAVEND